MNNLFSYSPKELTTDGFLAWLIYEIKGNNDESLAFFKRLGLCSNFALVISNIQVSRQEKNTDLIIRYDVDSIPHKALFENKTFSSIHSNQLLRYKEQFPDFQYYKFLKLARINYSESKEAKACGYDVIDSRILLEALDTISSGGEIVSHYKHFLRVHFVEPINEIETTMVSENKFHLLSDRQAQQHLIDGLYKSIDGINNSIYFKSHSNIDGTAWTQLDVSHKANVYGETSEYLFWRIDKKSGGHYLRLNQYANIGIEYKSEKKDNLEKLRAAITPLFTKYNLTTSKPSGRGSKESEVGIIFFKENHLERVVSSLVALTRDVIEQYQSVKY